MAMSKNLRSGAKSVKEFLDPDHLQTMLAYRAFLVIKQVATKMKQSKASASAKLNELFSMDIHRLTKLHLIAVCYERARKNIEKRNVTDPIIHSLILTCLANFALNEVRSDCTNLYESGFFGEGSSELLEGAYKQTLTDLRPQMVPLAELNPESSTPSTIGNEYGDIYELQLQTAKNTRLNTGKVPQLYHTHIKPVMQMVPPKL